MTDFAARMTRPDAGVDGTSVFWIFALALVDGWLMTEFEYLHEVPGVTDVFWATTTTPASRAAPFRAADRVAPRASGAGPQRSPSPPG